ncbi:MAG: hypothetical protein JNL87_21100 [Burkholderiaceae bacterium]|nr:hypothetical protein [Burkholderiaceae bacterium]
MAKAYYLRFVLRERSEDLFVPVRKSESDRLELALADACSGDARFFVLDTLKGRTFALNLAEVQAVRFLWDPSILPPDSTRDDGMIEVLLRGRAEPLEGGADDPAEVAAMFVMLDGGSEVGSFFGFQDEDGELLQLNPREVVWLAAPTHLLQGPRDDLGAGDDGLEGDF